MRHVLWKASALAQFRALLDYISDRDQTVADRLKASFQERIERLGEWPEIGRPGRLADTREFVLHPNYIVVYQVQPKRVIVLRVLHARQRYP